MTAREAVPAGAFSGVETAKAVLRGAATGSLATLNADGGPFASLVTVATSAAGEPIMLLSGLAATISLTRAGIRQVWSTGGRFAPHLQSVEAVAVLTLIFSCVLLTVCAEPVLRYTSDTAAGLHAPRSYVETVLSTKARLGPTQSTPEREGSP